ncbi:MAG: hypothetical protein KatS3mg038_1028 [Candidatus Kapaibacterium sp.]|nr:MAG: hypothetical protein KatS3mg038_1028 [Candidatus Kapabacteria bacterium]
MIEIFNGRNRGMHGARCSVFIKIDIAMRDYLSLFKNGRDANALAVFMAIALHSNEQGWAFLSHKRLQQVTGFDCRETIARAIEHLASLRIQGQRLLARYRVRRRNGTWGPTYYLLFPDWGYESTPPLKPGETLEPVLSAAQPCTVEPCMVEPNIEQEIYIEPEDSSARSSSAPRDASSCGSNVDRAQGSEKAARAQPPDIDTNASESASAGNRRNKAAPRSGYSRAELDALVKCLAKYVWEASPETCVRQIAVLLHGSKRSGQMGLLAYETGQRGGALPPVDELCGSVQRFVSWWKQNHTDKHGAPLSVPRGPNFLAHWSNWRSKSEQPECPLCKGTKVAYAVPRQLDESGALLWQIGGVALACEPEVRRIVCPCCGSGSHPYEYVTGRLHSLELKE